MKRSLILDFNVLKEIDITVEEFLFLYYISEQKEVNTQFVDLIKLQNNQFIKIRQNEKTTEYYLREKSIKLIEFLSVEIDNSYSAEEKNIRKSDRVIQEEMVKRLPEFREKWKGLKPGSMGSLKSCKLKLTRWMKENPEYNFDDILRAADIYLATFDGNYTYLQRADYFIFKQENNREESSRLSAYVDEIDIPTDEWTSSIN